MSDIQRILNMSIPEPNSGCWIWLGTTRGPSPERQYGRMTVGSRAAGTRVTVSAHRRSYELFRSEAIPDGIEVCHRCDNPLCVNPDHLWLGTKLQNMADRERKGRNKPSCGEKNGQSKLTYSQVDEIRKSSMGCRRLGKLYGVDKKVIQRIRNGTQWAASPTVEGA